MGTAAHRPGPHSWMSPDSDQADGPSGAGWVVPATQMPWREESPLGPKGVGSAGSPQGRLASEMELVHKVLWAWRWAGFGTQGSRED